MSVQEAKDNACHELPVEIEAFFIYVRHTRVRRLLGVLLCGLAVSACTPNYVPYAVDNNLRHTNQTDRSLPPIAVDPVQVTPDYRVFEAPDGSRYRIPGRLQLSLTPQGRVQAISLEHLRGCDLIFVANLAPSISAGPPYYPIQRLDLRPITYTPDINKFRVTVAPGSITTAPFSALVILQVYGCDTIEGFKSLLRTGAGFLLEADFDVMYTGQGVREVTVPVSLDNASISQETM